MNIFMNKRLIAALFVACAITGVQSLQAMKPKESVDLNKQLEIAVMKGNEQDVSSLLKLGVNVNKANEAGETPLFIAIKFLNTLPSSYAGTLNLERGDMDLDDLLLNIKKGFFCKDKFLWRLNIIMLLFEHGAVIDGKSSTLYKDLVLKSPNFPEYVVLDRYMKLLSGYAQQKDNASRAKYIESKRTTLYIIMYPFLVKVCLGRSLQEVNSNLSMDIKNTAIKSIYDIGGNARTGVMGYLNSFNEDFDKFIIDAANKNGYYLRPNFFKPVKVEVKKPVVPVSPKVTVPVKQAPVKQEVKPFVQVKQEVKPTVAPVKPMTKPVPAKPVTKPVPAKPTSKPLVGSGSTSTESIAKIGSVKQRIAESEALNKDKKQAKEVNKAQGKVESEKFLDEMFGQFGGVEALRKTIRELEEKAQDKDLTQEERAEILKTKEGLYKILNTAQELSKSMYNI